MAQKNKTRRNMFSKWPLWKKIVVLVLLFVILLLFLLCCYVFSKVDKIEQIEVEEEVIEESITEEVEHKTGFLNVAVFGLDSRDGNLGKGNRSDTIIIASLNFETNEVKLVSVYRDTLMKLHDGSYNKANAAYSIFGPEGGISLINQNLDLNIEKYVTVNFNALVDVIDAVGGIELDLTDAEVVHMNNYCVETSQVTGKSYERIEPEVAGTYHLNGVQAVSYSRIRYTAGGDAMRTERQRIVIGKLLEKMQCLNLSMVNDLIDSVFPQIATNFTLPEILTYAKDIKSYQLGESMGFPNSRTSEKLYGVGWTEIARTMASGAAEIHQFLFGDAEYQASSTVQEIDQEITRRLANGYYDEPVKKEERTSSEETTTDNEEVDSTTVTPEEPEIQEPENQEQEDNLYVPSDETFVSTTVEESEED